MQQIDAAAIVVTIEKGIVFSGHVRTYAEKIAAEHAVKSVKGVRAVAEEIEVRIPSELDINDSLIASRCLADANRHLGFVLAFIAGSGSRRSGREPSAFQGARELRDTRRKARRNIRRSCSTSIVLRFFTSYRCEKQCIQLHTFFLPLDCCNLVIVRPHVFIQSAHSVMNTTRKCRIR